MSAGEWLVLGASGQLGRELLASQLPEGVRLRPVPRAELDLARPEGIADVIAAARPSLVINAAAWTDVDGAESHEAEARVVNAQAVAVLAEACRDHGARLIHVSTDYVFGGVRPDQAPLA